MHRMQCRDDSPPSGIRSKAAEVAAVAVANLCMVNGGMVLGFPSAVLPPLLSDPSGVGGHATATLGQATWVAGSVFLSAPVASAVAGALVDRLGRRRSLLLLNAPFAGGWLLVAALPGSLAALAAGRLVSGIGLGLASCAAATYAAEASTAAGRTALVTLTPVMMAVGTFIVYLFAMLYQHSWTQVSWLGVTLSAVTLLLTSRLPESPRWLASRGRSEEAVRALGALRGGVAPAAERAELEALALEAGFGGLERSWSLGLLIGRLRRPTIYKPFLIMNTFFLLQNLSGVGIVIVFAVDIGRAAGVEAGAYHMALAIALERILSAILTLWLCSRLGRRKTATVSGLVMAAALLALAASLHFSMVTQSARPVLSGLLLLLYVLSSSAGFSALPWAMLGEIFPTDVRGVACGVTAGIVYVEAFFGAKLYPGLALAFGPINVFLFFGISAILGTLFVHFFLPETHGKTLVEIEHYFESK